MPYMGPQDLTQALAGVAALAGALAVGVCMVLCARSHFTEVWHRVRRLFAPRGGVVSDDGLRRQMEEEARDAEDAPGKEISPWRGRM